MTVPGKTPARHRLFFGPFAALEPKLFAELADLQHEDPLRPVTIVVASNLMGLHLRRLYVEWRETRGLSAAHGGLSFSTLAAFAAEIAGPGPAPLPAFGEFALLWDALARLPEARVFGDLAGRPELVPSLEATIRDLVDAGVAPKAFRAFAEGVSVPAERRLLLGAVARLYEAVERGSAGRDTPGKLFRRALAGMGADSSDPVLLYGFYDATGVQKDFLSGVARRRPVLAFVPRPVGRYGEFAGPFLEWVADKLGDSRQEVALPDSPLARFHRRLGGDPDAPADAHDSVRLLSAPTAAGERREVAREIAIAADAGIALHRVGVILRESNARSNALARELARLRIPNFEYAAASAAETPVGRAIALWWDLEEGDFPREEVLDVLDLLAERRVGADRSSARSLARKAGIARGASAWAERLEAHAAASASETEAAAARAFAEDCARLVASASAWLGGTRSWGEWANEISRRLETLFAPAEVPEPLRSAAEAVAALDELGGSIERAAAAHVFFGALEEQRETAGRLGVDGVFLGSAMAARGLTFSLTVVSRLVEREFPEPGRFDPLLFDDERRALADATGRPVPLKSELRPAEERQLFGMAVESAGNRLVLTTSRRDEALTRESLPSPFFTDAARAAGGSALRIVPMGVPVSEPPCLSPTEALERTLHEAGAETAAMVDPRLARALVRQERLATPRWTEFEGKLGPAARERLAAHRLFARGPFSASRLQMFATCSYRYFLRSIQGLREREEPERIAELDPLALGNAFHDAARRVVAASVSWPPPRAEAGSLSVRAAEEALSAREAKTGPIEPPLLREISRRRIEALLRRWIDHEEGRRDGLHPASAEKSFGGGDSPLLVDAGPFAVAVRGVIDRLDVDASGRPARVVDYKVKAAAELHHPFDHGARILGGEALQLALYALAVGAPVAAEYLFLMAGGGGDPVIETVSFTAAQTAEAIGELRTFLVGMDGAIASGSFLPRVAARLNKTPCTFCDFITVCGPGHIERFAGKEEDPSPEARALRAVRELP